MHLSIIHIVIGYIRCVHLVDHTQINYLGVTPVFSEMLHEDTLFKHRDLAALVASKVYYHLGSFEDSLTFALGADQLFDVNGTSEYVATIIGKYSGGNLIRIIVCTDKLWTCYENEG